MRAAEYGSERERENLLRPEALGLKGTNAVLLTIASCGSAMVS